MRPCPGDRAVHEAYDPRKLLKTARRPLSAIGLAMLLLAWLPRPAAASCIGYSLGEHVGRATAVFQGRVVAIEGIPQDGSIVRFAVERMWKGPLPSEIVLKHYHSSHVWWSFQAGRDYVVWAYSAPRPQALDEDQRIGAMPADPAMNSDGDLDGHKAVVCVPETLGVDRYT